MGGLKFEYKGKFYEVPHFPDKEDAYWMLSKGSCPKHGWCKKACYNRFGIFGGCVYGQYNAEARKAFYNQCFPERRPQEPKMDWDEVSFCETCANHEPETVSIEAPELIDKIWELKKPSWARWAAVDKSGLAYWYEKRPQIRDGIPHLWLVDETALTAKVPGHYSTANWKDSLIDLRDTCTLTRNEYINNLLRKLGVKFCRGSVVKEKPGCSQYYVARASNLSDLSDKVEDKMKFGWTPQGGVCKIEEFYCQAMVKEKEG